VGTINRNGIFYGGGSLVFGPAAQTIAAGNIITANACGTIKYITSASPVTTSTTDTFDGADNQNQGCEMRVCNSGANTITLDNNVNFLSAGGTDVVLTANDCISVASTGALWMQTTPLIAN
jgi:hypothetical protein